TRVGAVGRRDPWSRTTLRPRPPHAATERLERRTAPSVRASHPGDQLLHPLVDRPEGVLAQHGALRLVVELQVDPVDGEVPPLLLGAPDEVAAQPGPGGLRRHRLAL